MPSQIKNAGQNRKVPEDIRIKHIIIDNKRNVTQTFKFVFESFTKHCGEGENTGCQPFLLFQQYFQKSSSFGTVYS